MSLRMAVAALLKSGGRGVRRAEQKIQQDVIKHLQQRAFPGVVYWHTANGAFLGGNRARQGGILKSLGVRAGVSDVVALHRGKFFALELKAPKGRPTDSQLEFIADVQAAGGYGVV